MPWRLPRRCPNRGREPLPAPSRVPPPGNARRDAAHPLQPPGTRRTSDPCCPWSSPPAATGAHGSGALSGLLAPPAARSIRVAARRRFRWISAAHGERRSVYGWRPARRRRGPGRHRSRSFHGSRRAVVWTTRWRRTLLQVSPTGEGLAVGIPLGIRTVDDRRLASSNRVALPPQAGGRPCSRAVLPPSLPVSGTTRRRRCRSTSCISPWRRSHHAAGCLAA